jgi:hypothetical protein
VIEQRLLAQGHADEVYLFDLVNNPLPLWEGKIWDNDAEWQALLVTVSSADGGSYPIAELRMSSYKNNRIVYLPEHLIIRFVEKVFNEDPSTNSETAQPYFDDRKAYCLNLLIEYAGAFRQIRASGAGDLSTYTSGM